jgi:hypothetical protein
MIIKTSVLGAENRPHERVGEILSRDLGRLKRSHSSERLSIGSFYNE